MLIINSTAYSDSEIDTPNLDFPIVATSCGHHAMLSQERFRTIRPGRTDYQLIYGRNCPIYYYVDDQQYTASQNSFLLYHPGQIQHYEYYLKDNADVYWVHFTGNAVDEFLKTFRLDQELCYKSRDIRWYTEIYDHIIEELTFRRPMFLEYTSHLMQELLISLSRNVISTSEFDQTTASLMERAQAILNAHYQETISFSAIAAELNMSPSWFSKSFTAYFQTSPQKYLTDIRLNKAKMLLLSDASIKDIADLCGFPDQMYFSRVFKKYMNMSPSDYRKMQLESFQSLRRSALHSTYSNNRPKTHLGD